MASLSGSQNSATGTYTDDSQDMGALLAAETAEYPVFRRGDIVEGTVVGFSKDSVIVDVGGKSEGIVPGYEMQSFKRSHEVHQGDKVLVYIVQQDSQEGPMALSLDKARGEQGWRVLQDLMDANESLEANVVGFNKGGLLVDVEGVSGFVPLSQLLSVRQDRSESSDESLSSMVGQPLRLKVIELNRRRSRAILSERAAMQEWRAQQKEKLLSELQEGEIRRGRITGIRDFGIFVDIGGADGLAHMSEISWSKDKSPESMFKVGEEIDVYILKVDHENRKIALSLRRAQPEQWDNLIDRYEVGQVVQGQITKLTPFGAFARIEEGLEGLVHVSELAERRINHPKEVVKEGDVLPLKIVRIERDRHRLGLSLKQAREEAEADGYVFNDAGSIIGMPGEEEGERLGDASVSADEPTAGVAAQEEEDADQ